MIFKERRDASASWAWLLVLFFIPILGFILYLLFGHNLRRKHLFQWEDRKKNRDRKAAEVSAERSEVEAIPI